MDPLKNQTDTLAFNEEKKALSELISAVEALLRSYPKCLPYPDVGYYMTGSDYEDIDSLNARKRINKEFESNVIEPWEKHIGNPYFGRMDVNIDGEFKTVYIGERDLWLNDNEVVISGHSPLGDFYTQETLAKDVIRNKEYNALLRRKILISNKKLDLVEDIFVVGEDPKYKGITDPYLLEVLRRSRRQTGLSSILSSIQENQFNIVRNELKEPFVVQGCAGSGKTAIAFQRFARIQYNSPTYINERVRLISPNHKYNEFVDQLRNDLELRRITPITMLDYYFELLGRYQIGSNYEQSQIKEDNDFPAQDFIKYIYSDSFLYDEVINKGQAYINDCLKRIDYSNLIKSAKALNLKVPKHEELNNLDIISDFLSNTLSLVEKEILPNYEKESKKIEQASAIVDAYMSETNQQKTTLFSSIKEEIFALVRKYNSYKGADEARIWLDNPPEPKSVYGFRDIVVNYNNEINNKNASLDKEIDQINSQINSLNSKDEKNWEETIKPSLLNEQTKLQEMLSNTFFLSFIRKQRINSRLSEIESELRTHEKESSGIKRNKDELLNQINLINYKKGNLRPLPKEFVDQVQKVANVYDAIYYLTYSIKNTEEKKHLVSLLPSLRSIVEEKDLSFRKMFLSIMLPVIKDCGEKYKLRTSPNSLRLDGEMYAFVIYATLCFANCFLTKPLIKDKFICFDEGQEYSFNEYSLVYEINTDGEAVPIFNIYGDVNQRSSIKGIYDWSEINETIAPRLYVLRENYRNSREIVEYTNKKIGTNDIAIGFCDGVEVKDVDIQEAIRLVKQGSIWVIVKEDSEIYNELVKAGITIDKSDNNSVLLTPIMAKGQEYPRVIVFDKGMDKTEKYISYTRAKEELFVCNF